MSRKPSVTRDQEAVLRQFITGCETYDIYISNEYMTSILTMLGYKVAPNGARVHVDEDMKYAYGNPDVFEDVFDADGQEFTNEEIANNQDTPDASSSEPTESYSVGSLLRKKV